MSITRARRTLFSDPFTRADENPLSGGGQWQGGYTGSGTGDLQLVSNGVRALATATDSFAVVKGVPFASDQWVQFNASALNAADTNAIQALLRFADTPTTTGYLAIGSSVNIPGFTSAIYRYDDTTHTQLVAENTVGWLTTDILYFEASGITLNLYKSGKLLLTTTDATYTGGSPGLWLYANSVLADCVADNFSAGNLVSAQLPENTLRPAIFSPGRAR